MEETIDCLRGCCQLKFFPYRPLSQPFIVVKRSRKKAGIFIIEPGGKILLVQSKGNLWGCPKGTMKSSETDLECAIREVKEETGISIDPEVLRASPRFNNYRTRATYFRMVLPHQAVEVQTQISDNDANGIGWIYPRCLQELAQQKALSINQHCRMVIERFLGINVQNNLGYICESSGLS